MLSLTNKITTTSGEVVSVTINNPSYEEFCFMQDSDFKLVVTVDSSARKFKWSGTFHFETSWNAETSRYENAKIQTIKVVRDRLNLGLVDAKMFVENIMARGDYSEDRSYVSFNDFEATWEVAKHYGWMPSTL